MPGHVSGKGELLIGPIGVSLWCLGLVGFMWLRFELVPRAILIPGWGSLQGAGAGFAPSFLSFLTQYDTARVNWGLFGIESDFNYFVRLY